MIRLFSVPLSHHTGTPLAQEKSRATNKSSAILASHQQRPSTSVIFQLLPTKTAVTTTSTAIEPRRGGLFQPTPQSYIDSLPEYLSSTLSIVLLSTCSCDPFLRQQPLP
jgi:hypothetical protein